MDVLIIGAGAAGLAAWRELQSNRLNAAILEARPRLGGRIFTQRSMLTPIELGAEFIHGKPPAIWSLLKKANLDAMKIPGVRMVSDAGTLNFDINFWKAVEKINRRIDPTHDMPYADFLAEVEGSSFEKRAAKTYIEGFNAASAKNIGTAAIAVADQAADATDGKRQFRLSQGYGSLIDWMARDLRTVHLQTEVNEVRWQRHQVEVIANTPAGPRSFSAPRIIITVPLGVLRAQPPAHGAVRFTPFLPQLNVALAGLEMGHVIKLNISFRERFWDSFGRFGIAIALDEEIPTWWTQAPLDSNLLTGWAGGPVAEKLIELSKEQLLDRAIATLHNVFNKNTTDLRAQVDSIYYHNWTNDPFSRGAYSYPKVGGLAAAKALAEPIEDTIFFAGEATDFSGASGTVHAAVQSGISAARRLLQTASSD
jgi:monoamine oxidase